MIWLASAGLAVLIIIIIASRRYLNWIKRFRVTARTFDTYMDTTPAYMVVINEQARVEFISQSFAELFGLPSVGHAINRPLLDLCHPYEIKMIFQDVMESGGYIERNLELIINTKKRWMLLRSALMVEGGISRTFEMTDITPVMEAKNEAEAATRAKSNFLASMGREIRTPMNTIIGMTEQLLRKPLETEQFSQALSIKTASMSLLQIINDILDFSKIDAQIMDIVKAPFDFASFINDTVNLINIKASLAGLAFTTYIDKNIPPVITGDELRIKQALVNLLSNAVKFTEKGAVSLFITAERSERLILRFSVKDTGIGIRGEEMDKLFREPVRAEDSRHMAGAGLGLVITRRLIELMGGTLQAESVYGQGSAFTFCIVCEGGHTGALADLPSPEQYRVLAYESNTYQAAAMGAMFDNLGVNYVIYNKPADFKKFIKKKDNPFTHIFYDLSAEGIVKELSDSLSAAFFCIKDVNDLTDISVMGRYINRPVLITDMARILNSSHAIIREPDKMKTK